MDLRDEHPTSGESGSHDSGGHAPPRRRPSSRISGRKACQDTDYDLELCSGARRGRPILARWPGWLGDIACLAFVGNHGFLVRTARKNRSLATQTLQSSLSARGRGSQSQWASCTKQPISGVIVPRSETWWNVRGVHNAPVIVVSR